VGGRWNYRTCECRERSEFERQGEIDDFGREDEEPEEYFRTEDLYDDLGYRYNALMRKRNWWGIAMFSAFNSSFA